LKRRRVLVVDDEEAGRELLARGLARAGFDVATAADGGAAVAMLDQEWDCIVLDLVMPGVDGVALLTELNRREHRALRVVITSFADKDRVVSVLNLGADYLLEKPFGVERLKATIDELMEDRGKDPERLGQFFKRRLSGLPLTPRERELVILVLQGDSNKQIAGKLHLSEQTVKNTLSNAYARLGVQSRGELFHAVFPV
jgi:DNA-binding NarL/FixJ family response regulator